MHISVRDILEREFSTTGSEIALWVPIALQISIDAAHHCEAPDIKFTILVEQWLFNVLLNDVGPAITIYVSVLNQTFDVIEILAYLNATASIRILAWFDDPEALSQLGRGVQCRLLAWICRIMEELLEFEELRIVEALLDVVRERQMAVILVSYCLVVHLHIVVYCLFVAQVVIIFHFAILQ